MNLNALSLIPGSRRRPMRVGRGIGSGKGKTAGRGVKGQKSRSGVAIKGFEGGQMPVHRRLPKRGFSPLRPCTYQLLNLDVVSAALRAGKIMSGDELTIEKLVSLGLCSKSDVGVKVLGRGSLDVPLSFVVSAVSSSALKKIEALGGAVRFS